MAELQLADRKALVIGASSEAGRAIAVSLAAAGADVAVASATTNGDEVMAARRTRRAVEALGRHGAEYAFDTTLGQNVQVSTRQVAKEMGGLDLLVNAQDYAFDKPAERTTDAEWSRVLALNLGGVFFACRAAAREMGERGGCMFNVIPAADLDPAAGPAAYAAARYGVLGLTRSLALEYRGRGIRVFTIGFGAWPDGGHSSGVFDHTAAELGLADDLGELVASLAAGAGSDLSGRLLLARGAETRAR